MHLGIKLITLNHRLIHLCGASLQKFLRLALALLYIVELLNRKIRETIWLRNLEDFSNEVEMTNFSVYIITVFTNYAFEIVG